MATASIVTTRTTFGRRKILTAFNRVEEDLARLAADKGLREHGTSYELAYALTAEGILPDDLFAAFEHLWKAQSLMQDLSGDPPPALVREYVSYATDLSDAVSALSSKPC